MMITNKTDNHWLTHNNDSMQAKSEPPPKPPFRHLGNLFRPSKSDFWPFCIFLIFLRHFPISTGHFFRAKSTHKFMIEFFFKSYGLILYLKTQQKMHPAKRFEIFTPRQHGLLNSCAFSRCPSTPVSWKNLCISFQIDVAAAAIYGTDGHILSCVPTGYGKTMPMLITSLLLPPGNSINIMWKPSEGLKLQILFWSPWKLSWRGAHLGL